MNGQSETWVVSVLKAEGGAMRQRLYGPYASRDAARRSAKRRKRKGHSAIPVQLEPSR